MTLSQSAIDRCKALWEADEISASLIGERFGVSKNTIIGTAWRKGWKKPMRATAERKPNAGPKRIIYPHNTLLQVAPGEIIPTIFDRLNDLHAVMDRVLRETRIR